MNIQSLSVVVPNRCCINDCAFCVSRMHSEQYEYLISDEMPLYHLYEREYRKRLEFARDNGCNTAMLTGTSEPQQNKSFLKMFGTMNNSLDRPFRWIEMQTTGTKLDEDYLRFLRHHVGVSTISLSLSSLDSNQNAHICRMLSKIDVSKMCADIKGVGFNLRLSLNMSSAFGDEEPDDLLNECKGLGADQVTFRKLYAPKSSDNPAALERARWIFNNQYKHWDAITDYIRRTGIPLEILPFGATKYAIDGLSVVLDDDCMSKEAKEAVKYLILRPDCKLYSRWDEKASLIF